AGVDDQRLDGRRIREVDLFPSADLHGRRGALDDVDRVRAARAMHGDDVAIADRGVRKNQRAGVGRVQSGNEAAVRESGCVGSGGRNAVILGAGEAEYVDISGQVAYIQNAGAVAVHIDDVGVGRAATVDGNRSVRFGAYDEVTVLAVQAIERQRRQPDLRDWGPIVQVNRAVGWIDGELVSGIRSIDDEIVSAPAADGGQDGRGAKILVGQSQQVVDGQRAGVTRGAGSAGERVVA